MRSGIQRWCVIVLAAIALFVGSCTQPSESSPVSNATTSTPAAVNVDSANATDPTLGLPMLQGKATVEMVVNGGTIAIEVDGDNAPVTAGNFVDLVNRGVYDGVVFHRVVREPQPFVVQGGDPQSKDPNIPASRYGTGGFVDPDTNQPRYIPLEIKPEGASAPIYNQTFETAKIAQPPVLSHTRGAVAMARSQFPDSASSQFYFALADLSFLDGNYAVFGYVTQGMDVVDAIQQGDLLESAKVTSGLENLKPAE